MNLLLVLREEILCLIILMFLFVNSQLYKMGKDNSCFFRLCIYAMGHVIFDMITVCSVNCMDVIPETMNWIAHVLFYLFAILFARELLIYIVKLVGLEPLEKWFRWISMVILCCYIALLPFLPMLFLQGKGTIYSYGMAAFVGYAVAFLYLFVGGVLIARYYKVVSPHVRKTMVPMVLIMIAAEVIQIAVPELLFTGADVTIATVGIFFGLENPAAVFRKKAMMDALTGVKSRNAYELEMKEMKADYEKGKYNNLPVGLVFCDLNNLKKVNDLYGHLEGDEYIGITAQIMMEKMVSAKDIYRMGGDEFLVVYIGVSPDMIEQEIEDVRSTCKLLDGKYLFKVEIAMGYALSGEEYRTLQDVLRAADYNMYQNKWRMKQESFH